MLLTEVRLEFDPVIGAAGRIPVLQVGELTRRQPAATESRRWASGVSTAAASSSVQNRTCRISVGCRTRPDSSASASSPPSKIISTASSQPR